MATLIKTPLVSTTPTNAFRFVFSYSHGDADNQSSYTATYRMTDDECLAYLAGVEDLISHIDDVRQGAKADADLYEKRAAGFSIPVEEDMIYSRVPASLTIDSIKYYDSHGACFSVTKQK